MGVGRAADGKREEKRVVIIYYIEFIVLISCPVLQFIRGPLCLLTLLLPILFPLLLCQ